MKFSCAQTSLNRGLSVVGHAVATKSTMPVLSNILLQAEAGDLKLAATNLEISITCRIPCDVTDPGTVTVPAKLFAEFVGSLPEGKVDVALNEANQTLHVNSLRYQANIKGIDAADFPSIPQIDSAIRANVPASVLRETIQQVVFAAATDETRPVLAGVLLTFQPGSMILAAADGFRLAVKKVEIEEAPSEAVSILVPARSLTELARIIGDSEEMITIAITSNRSQVLFKSGDVELISRLIDGTFPNYQQIIPKSHQTRTVIGTADFLKATKIAFFFARDNANIVKLEMSPGNGDLEPGSLKVSAATAELGDNVTELDAVVEGQECQIAFNAKYLADVLNVIGTSQVVLETIAATNPGLVRPLGDESYTHIIMPMHLGSR